MFRSRGKGPALKEINGNIYSDKLPGGNLILAVLDRELMTWSDRGGASRHYGDCWSNFVTGHFSHQIGSERPADAGETFTLETVVRLDDDTRIAIQAGRHKLTNPDFVLFGRTSDDEPILQAADSKFSVDTIKPAQVSADALQALLDVEDGLVRAALEETIHDHHVATASVIGGVFVSPTGPLTDFFLPRLLSDPRTEIARSQIELVDVGPSKLFGGLDEARLIAPLARIDRLPASPRDHLLAAMYYLRVACASSWMWVEERTPLLSDNGAPAADFDAILKEVENRSERASSAFDLAANWFQAVEEITRNRKSLSEVMSLPVRMGEIRKLVESAGFGDDRRMVRTVRALLDQAYRRRMFEELGVIPATPAEPITEVLQRVASVSRSLRPEMRLLASALVEQAADQQDA